MKWKVLLIVALLVGGSAAVGASLGVFGASAANATSDYLTAQAAVTDVVAQVAATGTVAASASWGLAFGTTAHAAATTASAASGAASITWPVTKVSVAVGDKVIKGQVLATAATTDLQAQIADATRANTSAVIQLAQATTARSNATTTDAIRQTRIGLYSAQTGAAHALQTLNDLKAKLALATLKAPSAGTVTAVSIVAGADALALCLGAILAYPVQWQRRLAGAAGGVGLILGLNILRIGTLGRVAATPEWFNTLHVYVWPVVLTLAIAG